jgi:hypothetical protein
LHGHRKGGPPSNECGSTNGDNEVWNLAKDGLHYDAIVTIMRLREQLRNYAAEINAKTASEGLPMSRPMFLDFPNDPNCSTADVEDQFMFGPTWLVAPVVVSGASSRSVYLPQLAPNEVWVYYFNDTVVPYSGVRVTVATPIDEFPLFYRKEIAPPVTTNATNLFDAQRQDTALCLSPQCFQSNLPPEQNYTELWVEGLGLLTSSPVVLGGVSYATAPLNLFFSFTHNDNFVSTATTPPDSTYTVTFNDGYVLTTAAPGTVPLQVWYNPLMQDHATVASPQGLARMKSLNYIFQATVGYVFPVEV